MTELNGQLEAYYEQGWEGRIEFAVNTVDSARPIFLESGHHLTIYDTNESILWAGTIQFVKRKYSEKHNLQAGIWSWSKQKGVPYGDWMDWFWRKPALKAKLVINERVVGQKDHADVKFHPPILLLIHLALVAVLTKIFPLAVGVIPAWIGYPIVLFGSVIGVFGIRQLGKANTTVDPHGSVSTIVTDGPYRFSRNPIYIGLASILIGIPLIFESLWGAILLPLFILSLNYYVIRPEEVYLEKKFGDEYTSFKSRVRRWF